MRAAVDARRYQVMRDRIRYSGAGWGSKLGDFGWLQRASDRAHILSSAFAAFEQGEYNLAVPVLLIQADGICAELIDIQLFSRRGNRPATATYVATVAADSLRAALLAPLATALPISASAVERETFSLSGLNRHTILHGESVNYGTRQNALKAISLLSYLAHVLHREGSHEKTALPKVDEDVTPKD
jgi:hypothetical protein